MQPTAIEYCPHLRKTVDSLHTQEKLTSANPYIQSFILQISVHIYHMQGLVSGLRTQRSLKGLGISKDEKIHGKQRKRETLNPYESNHLREGMKILRVVQNTACDQVQGGVCWLWG